MDQKKEDTFQTQCSTIHTTQLIRNDETWQTNTFSTLTITITVATQKFTIYAIEAYYKMKQNILT